MAAGVGIVDPRTTVIDVDVEIGQDTTIEPFTTIRGATRIGESCVVRHSYLIDSVLEDGATVGPFAYLRPGSVLREGSKAGTFVEIKNSDIGAGAKIPHLSYIGDADVGAHANLGASTITANYDGRRQAPHDDRPRGAQQRARLVRGARERRRGGLYGRRLDDRSGRAAGRAGHRARAPDEHRGVRAAAGTSRAGGGVVSHGRPGRVRDRRAGPLHSLTR